MLISNFDKTLKKLERWLRNCLSLDLKSNDELWTVPNSFVASSNCGLYCGAKIDFVDIIKEHFNINLKQLENKLKKKVPKVLVTVHLGGQPCEQEKVWKLAKKCCIL